MARAVCGHLTGCSLPSARRIGRSAESGAAPAFHLRGVASHQKGIKFERKEASTSPAISFLEEKTAQAAVVKEVSSVSGEEENLQSLRPPLLRYPSPSIHDNTGKEEEGMDRGKKKMTVEELKAKIRAKKALVEAKKRKRFAPKGFPSHRRRTRKAQKRNRP